MVGNYFGDFRYRSKARLVQGGVDTTKFSARVAPHLRLREQFGIPGGAPVVACVAQLVRAKGHPTLLQAAAKIDDLHLWLVGKPADEEYAKSLREMVVELGLSSRVRFLENIGDIPALLAETDIFVLPTWARNGHEEGCPVALLEAMAAGKSCVATDVAGSRDLVEHGVSGLLVAPESVGQLVDALRQLLSSSDQRRVMGLEARKRVETAFTLEKESAGMQAVYEELIG
jgi:glycosyltransferase involved in cell wall biosynthesis